MARWQRALAGVVIVLGAAIAVYALLTPQQTTDSTGHMGMFGSHSTYSSINVALVTVGIIAVVAGLMIVLLKEDYVPLPPAMLPPPPQNPAPIGPEAVAQPSEEHLNEDSISKEYLALRLLTGDERIMFKTLMDSGGEALQRNLITATKMSNAKVSRVLDRLQAKGIVTKERFGSTNKVRIKMEP